jgi:3-isopropylmalate/(R)-2-methylmalate dehydratase small subunit
MDAFTKLTGVAAPLPMANVDTDKIIPARFLKTIKRTGLGKNLFDTLRFTPDGAERPDFVLNQEPWRNAEVLVAGPNFGCGSSREHAPWALEDYGFRVIVAPSFADIFFNNCFKNGVLPIALPESDVDWLFHEVQAFPGFELVVDLPGQALTTADGARRFAFEVDAFRKYCLVNGFDEIGLTLRHADRIRAFEAERLAAKPWLAQTLAR